MRAISTRCGGDDAQLPRGPGNIGLVMFYKVRAGRIARAWTIPDQKTLDHPA